MCAPVSYLSLLLQKKLQLLLEMLKRLKASGSVTGDSASRLMPKNRVVVIRNQVLLSVFGLATTHLKHLPGELSDVCLGLLLHLS